MEEAKVKYLVFDIESVPDTDLIKSVKFPGENISGDEAVEKFQEEILKITGGTSNFIPATFQIPVSLVVAKVDENFRLMEIVSMDEPNYRTEEITRRFWYGIESLYKDATIVTFNGRGFDVPLMEFCAYKIGISAKRHFSDKGGTRYRNGARHIDMQEYMSNNHAVKLAGGLNVLAKMIGCPGKMETKGSEVHELYKAGKIEDINDYCICDVLDTYFIFVRSRVLCGDITSIREGELRAHAREYMEKLFDKRPVFKKYLDAVKWS